MTRWDLAALASVSTLFFALVLRAAADAPYVLLADDTALLERALWMARSGELNPRWFHYPTFVLYLHAALATLVSWLVGWPLPPPGPAADACAPEAYGFYVVSRALTAGFAAAHLAASYALLRRVAAGPFALALLVMLASSDVVVEQGWKVGVDAPAAAFVSLSLCFVTRFAAREGGVGALLVATLFGALAGSAKYPGALVLGCVPVAVWLARRSVADVLVLTPPCAAIAVATFVLTNPFAVVDHETFLSAELGFLAEVHHYFYVGHLGHEGSSALKALGTLWDVAPLLCLLAPLAPMTAPRAHRALVLVLVVAALLHLAPVAAAKAFFERNVLLMTTPFVGLIAAAAPSLPGRLARLRRPLLVLALALAASGAFGVGRDVARAYRETDSRAASLAWLARELPPGAVVVREWYTPQLEHLHSVRSTRVRSMADVDPEQLTRAAEWVVTSSLMEQRFPEGAGAYGALKQITPVREWSPALDEGLRGPVVKLYRLAPR